MRKIIKRQLEELLSSMQEMHKTAMATEDPDSRLMFLGECQQAATTVGEAVEKNVPGDQAIVPQLEQYCEEVFLLSGEAMVGKDSLALLDSLVESVRKLLEELTLTYHVVFMPYKAEMWDSLESIWEACKEDPRCECCVVPLPYYDYNANTDNWEFRYEGGRFPEGVPVTDYKNYSLEAVCPELAYIHNPYDDINFVTKIHPSYYSHELKKYVEKLVYVPYYVTSGFFSQLNLPAYAHMDYMILQSESAREYCKELYYYDKVLPLGSPKIDKIIRTCREGVEIPDEWKPMLEGKKVLMLNTSIGSLLSEGESLLKKIRYLCAVFSRQKSVALIWRPHPLLETTIKSMRPYLLSEYREIVQYFLDLQIGVLDRTPDIERTVALSDGYIGEESTSVINLFEVAGKPIFILNNYITDSFTEEERRRVIITVMVKQGERLWGVTGLYNALLWLDESTKQPHLAGHVEGQFRWSCAFVRLAVREDTLFLSPCLNPYFNRCINPCPVAYHIEKSEFEPLPPLPEQETNLYYRNVVPYEDKIFYLPALFGPIMEYNIRTKLWKFHLECIEKLVGDADTEGQARTTVDCAVAGDSLWITTSYTNRVLQFRMNNGSYFLYAVGQDEYGYSGVTAEGENLWLAEVHGGDVIRWNRFTKKIRICHMPEDFCHWEDRAGAELAHASLIDMGRWLVTVPGYSNGMVKIDKATRKASMLVSDFWQDVGREGNNYRPDINASGAFGMKMDDVTILVYRCYDGAAAIINVEAETYEIFYPTLSEEDFARLTEGEDGFERLRKDAGFCRRESMIFSLEGFMEDLVHNRLEAVRERQLKGLEGMAANLDGTCGEKVHEFMMGVLEE